MAASFRLLGNARSVASPAGVRRESGLTPAVDRRALGQAALAEGDALLAQGLLEQAGERFQAAARAFDEAGDPAGSARALLGLGKVLLGLEDPVSREVLEDAGTTFEDLGDEPRVREIDHLLRSAEASFDESPRSFVAGHGRASSVPPRRTRLG